MANITMEEEQRLLAEEVTTPTDTRPAETERDDAQRCWHKLTSEIADYSMLYDLLHFHFDL